MDWLKPPREDCRLLWPDVGAQEVVLLLFAFDQVEHRVDHKVVVTEEPILRDALVEAVDLKILEPDRFVLKQSNQVLLEKVLVSRNCIEVVVQEGSGGEVVGESQDVLGDQSDDPYQFHEGTTVVGLSHVD